MEFKNIILLAVCSIGVRATDDQWVDWPEDLQSCTDIREAGDCHQLRTVWGFDVDNNQCVSYSFSGCGGYRNRFTSREDCEDRCKDFFKKTPREICNQAVTIGDCRGSKPRYAYNPETKRCEEFRYGGCGGNLNRFRTRVSCNNFCNEYQLSLQ